ncbi:MAG: dihydroneopterin aldolase [Bernardetiaceae bacterium]
MNAHTISLEGLEFFAYHGVLPEEQEIGNRYRVDAHLTLDLWPAALSDDLKDTVDYGQLYQIIAQEMKKPAQLLEYLAGCIINRALDTFPAVVRVKVVLYKHNPPVGGLAQWSKVTIERARTQ